MKTLADFVEEISDDFNSTFTVGDDNVLINMMRPKEHGRVAEIIHKYLPGAELEFIKCNMLDLDTYFDEDVYVVRVVK